MLHSGEVLIGYYNNALQTSSEIMASLGKEACSNRLTTICRSVLWGELERNIKRQCRRQIEVA